MNDDAIITQNVNYRISYLLYFYWKTMSPFQSQLTILQNAINNWYTLRDNFSNPHAETLLQTGVSCSYVPYVIIAKYVLFQRHFYDNDKRLKFFIVC